MALSPFARETRFMSALDQARLVRENKASPSELLNATIERYEAFNPHINAVNITWLEHARELAEQADKQHSDAPFHGVPTLFKISASCTPVNEFLMATKP